MALLTSKTVGERDELIAEARRRMKANPGKYVNHIYGEHEAGGTGMLYLSGVGFEQLGFPSVGMNGYVSPAAAALSAVPPASITVGIALAGISLVTRRREEVARAEGAEGTQVPAPKPAHVEFAALGAQPFYNNTNKMLLTIMGFGAFSFVLRFLFGLGGATGLSDTFPWGLWIIFDLVWIALAAGAFATAGLIYVSRRKDLYPLGRSALLLGLLSYSFVTVTLIADLGRPWNGYQLLINAPHHSAMYEVSWCITLYVTILALEFLPVVLGKLGMQKYVATWQKYAPWYVVGAVTLFIFMMSHSLLWTALAAVVFSLLAFVFRGREGEPAQPIMLAIAAVTFSTMHQSSLVVACNACVLPPFVRRRRNVCGCAGGTVDCQGLQTSAANRATSRDGPHDLLVSVGLRDIPPRRPDVPRTMDQLAGPS
jgi:formate dehydrogenase iron-sulfur subunit